MGELTEKLKALTVRVLSPDGNIDAVLHSWEEAVEIAFREDSYERLYTEESLGYQLSRVLTLLMIGRQRGHAQALETSGWQTRDYSKPHWDKQEREFEKIAFDTQTFGESLNDYIRVDSTALHSFSVSIAPGTTTELEEEMFVKEFASAITDLLADWRMVVSELRAVPPK
jgi:hypothetical protein